MKTVTETVGTSPEVLQHYLTAVIDCEVTNNVPYFRKGERAALVALNMQQSPNKVGLLAEGKGVYWVFPGDCLPVLRPFSALCTPLEDGTVPAAIDFVRSFLADQYGMDWSAAHIDKVYENGDIMVSIPDRHPTRYDHSYVLHHDWASLPLEAHAWLVKNHFAVGLEPHQYIEKAPAATPIQEGNSQS